MIVFWLLQMSVSISQEQTRLRVRRAQSRRSGECRATPSSWKPCSDRPNGQTGLSTRMDRAHVELIQSSSNISEVFGSYHSQRMMFIARQDRSRSSAVSPLRRALESPIDWKTADSRDSQVS